MPRPPKRPPNRADGRYEKKYTIEGLPKRKSFYSYKSYEDCDRQAKEYEAMLKAHILVGNSLITKEATFEEWAETWLEDYKEGKVKESTYKETYERTVNSYLIPYFGNMRLEAIKPVDIQRFVKTQKDIYSQSTMKKMRLCLNGIFNTAIDNDLCRKNPAKNVSFVSNIESVAKRTYSQNEVDIILKYCDSHPLGIYIRILLELGLRCSELCGLKKADFDLNNKIVHIQRAITEVNNKSFIGKTKNKSSNRKLPVSSTLTCLISKINISSNKFLLHTSNNREMTPAYFTKIIYNKFYADLQIAHPEIERLSPHELRHTCGTLLYERTKDIYAVSKYLGHSNVQITAKLYVHDSAELLRANLGII